jgi:hypothetical protein
MPFSFLVSALGAIVAVAFTMFGLHSWGALKFAPIIGASLGFLLATMVELPGTLLGWDFTHAMCVAGWPSVLAGTVWLNLRFTTYAIKLDIFQMVGGVGAVLFFGSFMYTFVVAPDEAKVTSLIDLAKIYSF